MSNFCKAWDLVGVKAYTEFRSVDNSLEISVSVEKARDDFPVVNFSPSVGKLVIESFVVKEYRKSVEELFDGGKITGLVLGIKNYSFVEYIGLSELVKGESSESLFFFNDAEKVMFRKNFFESGSWPEDYRRFVNGRLSVYFSDFLDCVPECKDDLEKKLILFRPEGYVPSVRKEFKRVFGDDDVPGSSKVSEHYISGKKGLLSFLKDRKK